MPCRLNINLQYSTIITIFFYVLLHAALSLMKFHYKCLSGVTTLVIIIYNYLFVIIWGSFSLPRNCYAITPMLVVKRWIYFVLLLLFVDNWLTFWNKENEWKHLLFALTKLCKIYNNISKCPWNITGRLIIEYRIKFVLQ